MTDKLRGTTFPEDGKNFHQSDWQYEQESKATELIDRQKDIAGTGIVEGGLVVPGTNSGTIKISETTAYNDSGQRIYLEEIDNFIVPDGSHKVAIRHKFNSIPNNNQQGYPIQHRSNSYEIVFRQTLEIDDVGLFEVTNSSGTITIDNDIRQYWKMKIISGDLTDIENRLDDIEENQDIQDLISSAIGWDKVVSTPYDKPPQIIASNQDKRLKQVITYDSSDMPTEVIYSYSTDAGTNYTVIGTKTLTWNNGLFEKEEWS